MSSNAALSAARRRRSNPVPTGPPTHMQPPPANRILQRTGVPPPVQHQQHPQHPQHPQFSQQRMPPPQGQMRPPPPQMQSKGRQPQQPPPQSMTRPQSSSGLPPLPPPVKTAGPLYGIPIHPLMMFKTHDNKLSEHELSIGDCFEQLKEIDERLTAFEASNGNNGGNAIGDVPGGDLNDLMNDGAFINGIVDNIMNTTNFASIVENVIPLKEENEALKQEIQGLNEKVHGLNEKVHGLEEQIQSWKDKMQQLEDQVRSICSGASVAAHVSSDTVVTVEVGEAAPNDEQGEEDEDEEDEEGEEGEEE